MKNLSKQRPPTADIRPHTGRRRETERGGGLVASEEDRQRKKKEEEWGEEMKGGVGGGGGSSYTLHPKRRWKGFVVAVLGLVILSMLVPLIFLLGLHNGFHSLGISLTFISAHPTFLYSDLFIVFLLLISVGFYLRSGNYGLFLFAFGFWVSGATLLVSSFFSPFLFLTVPRFLLVFVYLAE